MYNTYLTSRISLRTRGSLSYNDYSNCSIERHPFVYSSSRTCSCCCTSSICKVPVNPSYCYNLYGLRQSSLIQWSNCRKMISGGYDRRYCYRLPICDVGRRCTCDDICSFREKFRGLRKCLVFEESCESYDLEGVDEAEALLSLLTENTGDDYVHVRKETKRVVKKPLVEKRENGEVSKKCGSQRRVDVGVWGSNSKHEDESVAFGSRNKDRRRDERIRREEKMEALLREKDRTDMLLERDRDSRREERIRREEERDELSAFGSRKKDNRRDERIRREEDRDELAVYGSRNKDRRDERIRREDERDESVVYKNDRREERIRREEERDESMVFGSKKKDNWRDERIKREDLRDESVVYKNNRREESIRRDEERDESTVFGSRNKDNRRNERIRRDESVINKDSRRDERIRRDEEREALIREHNQKAMLQEENEYLLANRIKREKEEKESFLRKLSQNDERKQEKESMLEREKWSVRARKEEREDLLRRDEQKHKTRKDGSSCSSYYSVSSAGDYDSDNEIELSSSYNRDSTSNEIVKMKNEKEIAAGSSVVESDFRKKSEKKLSDVSVEEMESRKELSQRESRFSVDHESKNKKSYDYYVGYDDRKVKSDESMKFDGQKYMQTGDEVSRQYKQFVEIKDNRNDGVKNSYGSQEISEIQDIDLRKTSISQQEIDRRKTSISQQEIDRRKTSVSQQDIDRRKTSISQQEIDLRKTSISQQEIDLRKTSISQQEIDLRKTTISQQEIDLKKTSISQQEIDLKKTSISQQEIDLKKTSISQQDSGFRKGAISQQGIESSAKKDEDYSTNIHHEVSGALESSGKFQQLTRKEGTSILKRPSDNKLTKEEEKVNITYGSSLESKGERSQKHAKVNRTNNPESSELTKLPITHSGEFGETDIDDRKKTKMEVLVRPSSSRLPEIGALPVESNFGMATDEGSYGSSQFGSAASQGDSLEISQGQSSKFISQEDAIGSVARLEKSSSRYVDEFVDNVKNEILNSGIQSENETNETKLVIEDEQQGKALVQYTSGRKGPSDEMWDVDKQSVKPEVQQDDSSKGGNAIVKRTGKSVWNVITDIVRLRWGPHSENHSSGRKSSPNKSTSSETWFSGHEAEEHDVGTKEDERRSMKQGGSSSSQQEGKYPSRDEAGPSSSTSDGYLKNVGSNMPSSSSAEIVEISSPPALKMRRSRRVSENEDANASNSSLSELQTNVSMDQSEASISEQELKQNKLRRKDQVLRDRFDEWEEAYRLDAEQQKIDEMFMREALLEARKAADNWEVPIGAVLVQNGKIIARGCNLVEELRDSTAHAEMICIREASNVLRSWRLSETTLYVTLEPCPMCAGAILQARIDTVVWGAPNKLLGADGSWIRLFPNGDGTNETDKPAPPVHPFHPKITIRRRVLASECADTMQQFFRLRRKKDNKPNPPNSPPSRLHVSHHPSKLLTKLHDAFRITFCL